MIIKRQMWAFVLLSTAFLASLVARQLGFVRVGGASDGFDALLLLGGLCFGGAAIILILLRGSRRNKRRANDATDD